MVYSGRSNLNGRGRQQKPELIFAGQEGVLYQGDCLTLLSNLLPDSIDMAFADPPFNLGKHYGTNTFEDQLATDEYRLWCQTWLMELVRVLRPGGALFVYHWPKWLMELGAWLNTIPTLEYRSWIAMKMKNGFPIRNRLHPAHYGLLYYVKRGAKPTFNVVRHRIPTCRHCRGELPDYGGYRKKFAKYEDGTGTPWIQISDFWEDTRPERSAKSRDGIVNELPMHVPERAILMATHPGDTVLDIFGGSGSTYHAAQYHGRKWIGGEIADVTPIMRRMATCFPLEIATDGNEILDSHFRPEFAVASVETFYKNQQPGKIEATQPFEGKAASFHKNASKSKVIGY